MTLYSSSAFVENQFDVLSRFSGLFGERCNNIHTLKVAQSLELDFSRMTRVLKEKKNVLCRIIKKLRKLTNEVEMIDYREYESINREGILLCVGVSSEIEQSWLAFSGFFVSGDRN